MKVTVDVDCTPEEARRFLGLPDLGPLHDSYVDRMRGFMENGLTTENVQAIIQSWGPMGDAGMAMWRNLFDHLGGRKSAS